MKNSKDNLQYIAGIVIDYLRVLALIDLSEDNDILELVDKWLNNTYDVFCRDK